MNDLFKALADPTRRAILDKLREGEMSAGDITGCFHITGASISHHMTILHNAGLVLKERKGQQIIYSLNTTVFQEVIEWIFKIRGENNENQ